jgi:hypothetical protein
MPADEAGRVTLRGETMMTSRWVRWAAAAAALMMATCGIAAGGDGAKARRAAISRSTPRPSIIPSRNHASLYMVRKKSGPGRLALKGTFQIGRPNPREPG